MFNINFFNQSKQTLINQYILKYINKHQQRALIIFTPNPEQVVLSQRNPTFLAALQSADICIPDGIGLVIASRFLFPISEGSKIQERITGIDVMSEVLRQLPELKYLVIGGRDDREPMQLRTVEVLGVKVNWLPGYADISTPSPAEEKQVRALIHQVKPDIVFVAFGAPYQELWVIRHRSYLEAEDVKIVMVIGGALEMLTGKVRRAPRWVRSIGLEWSFRFTQQPWRLKRQLQLFRYLHLVWKERFWSATSH